MSRYYDDVDSPGYNDTNCGPGMVYDTPEEKEIERLHKRIRELTSRLAQAEQDYADCQSTLKDERYCHGQTIASLKVAASQVIKAANDRLAQAESVGMERAAKICEKHARLDHTLWDFAAAIRTEIGKAG